MNLLWVATKSPWPPIDGGRRLLLDTLSALAAAGHRVVLVAPVDPRRFDLAELTRSLEPFCLPALVPSRPCSALAAGLRAELSRRPWTIARHDLAAVGVRVRELAAGGSFELVVAEQLQALAACEPAAHLGLPVVLRAQNVESDLWQASATLSHGLASTLLRREARRLERFEGAAVRRAALTVALTSEDAARLRALAGGGEIEVVPAPFETELPAAERVLPGDPAVVVLGSAGWRPNRTGAERFVREIWPRVLAELPRARLHLFGLGAAGEGIVAHPEPEASREAFAPGAVMAVPLWVASGVRIKILEAWARGLPVVATPEAARGLGAEDGRELLLARDAGEFAAALARLHREPGLGARLVVEGRARLAAAHAFPCVAAGFAQLFAAVAAGLDMGAPSR